MQLGTIDETPADRLERALHELEARKSAAAETAAKHAPEMERMNALQARVSALPQAQRRAVLDAVGLKHVSAVAPAIETVRGRGSPSRRDSPQPIRWALWSALPHVELWRAVALSLNINPADELRDAVRRGTSRFSSLPREYFERLDACIQALSSHGPLTPQGSLYPGVLQDTNCRVRLAEVAQFLSRAGFEVASELVAATAAAEPRRNNGPVLKRYALVRKHERNWPTIDRDLKDGGDNGLSAAAKASNHGMWLEDAALEWAASKGKLRNSGRMSPAQPFDGLESR